MIRQATKYDCNNVDEPQQPDADSQNGVDGSDHSDSRQPEAGESMQKSKTTDSRDKSTTQTSKSNLRPILPKNSYAIVAKLQNFVANSFPPVSTLLDTTSDPMPVLVERTVPSNSLKMLQTQIHCLPGSFGLCQKVPANQGNSPEGLVMHQKPFLPITVSGSTLITIVPDMRNTPLHVTDKEEEKLKGTKDDHCDRDKTEVSGALTVNSESSIKEAGCAKSCPATYESGSTNCSPDNIEESLGVTDSATSSFVNEPLRNKEDTTTYSRNCSDHINHRTSPSTSSQITSIVTTCNALDSETGAKCNVTTATETPFMHRSPGSRVLKGAQEDLIEKAKSYRFASGKSQAPLYVSQDIVLSGGIAQQNRRRIIHNQVEKRRKEKINGWIGRIGELLFRYCPEKQSKNVILEKTYEFIQETQEENNQKSKTCSCGGKTSDRNNLPELVAKIAELENLVKVLLQTVTKHRVPVPPSVKQCGGHFTKHLDLIYENTLPQLSKTSVSGSSSRGSGGEKRFCDKSSLPFISSVMYSRPTPSENTAGRSDNQAPTSNNSESVSSASISTSIPQVNPNTIYSRASPSNSCPPPPSISHVWTEQTASTEASLQHPQKPIPTDSSLVSFFNASANSSPVNVTSATSVYTVNTVTQVGVPLVGYVLSISAPQESSTCSKDVQQSVMTAKETETSNSTANGVVYGLNSQSLCRTGQHDSEKNCTYPKMVNYGSDFPRLLVRVGDKTNESSYSVSSLISFSQSMDSVTSKVSSSLSGTAPSHIPCGMTETTDRGITVPCTSFVSSSASEKFVSVGHLVQSSMVKSASGKLDKSPLPCKHVVLEKSSLSHSNSRSDAICSIADQATVTRESTNLPLPRNTKSLTIVGPQSAPATLTGSAPQTVGNVGSSMAHESQNIALMSSTQNQGSNTSGISPLVVNHTYTTSFSQQLLQHSGSEHPSPTYPITPARTNASTVSLCKNLHFNRPAQVFTSIEKPKNTASEENQSPSKQLSIEPKQKVPSKPLYSVSRLLGESKGPSNFIGEEQTSKSASSTETGGIDFGVHPPTLPSIVPPVLPNQHILSTPQEQSCSFVSVSPLSQTKTKTSSTLAITNAVSTSPFVTAKGPYENQVIPMSTSVRESMTGITFAAQIPHSSPAKETISARKSAKRKGRETSFSMNNSDILMTSFQLPSKRAKPAASVSYGGTARERTSSSKKELPGPSAARGVTNMKASRIDNIDVPSKSNASTIAKTELCCSLAKEVSNHKDLASIKKSASGTNSLENRSSLHKKVAPSKCQQGSKNAKYSEGGRSNNGKKVNSTNGEGGTGQLPETVVSASINSKKGNAPMIGVRANILRKDVPISKSGHNLKPNCSLSSFYPKPQNFISLAGQGHRKPDGITPYANSQNFSTEAILRQNSQNSSEMNVQSCNAGFQLPISVSSNTPSLPRADMISGHIPGAVAQDNNFPTILNIFAPVSLNNMIQFNNSSLSNAGEDALPLPSSLSGVHSTYSNFSAEALIGALDNQPLSGTVPAHPNIPDNNSSMLVQPGNQHLFTDFSTDTLLNASDTNLSYGIDNIMSRQENTSTVSCVSPNWLQNGGFVTENSPIKSIMSILESTTHVSSGLTYPGSQSGSLTGTLPYTATSASLHGPQGNLVIGQGKSYVETSLVRNDDMLASTPMWCWGANSVTGQPVPGGYAVVQGERSRLGGGNGSIQASKPGPSYGNFLLVNSVS